MRDIYAILSMCQNVLYSSPESHDIHFSSYRALQLLLFRYHDKKITESNTETIISDKADYTLEFFFNFTEFIARYSLVPWAGSVTH